MSDKVAQLWLHTTMVAARGYAGAVAGSFTRSGALEVVCYTVDALTINEVETTRGSLRFIRRTPMFSTIQAVVTIRCAQSAVLGGAAGTRTDSTATDELAITSDSGKLVLLRYQAEGWVCVSSVVIGRSGIRIGGVGHYLAVDPMYRALFIGAPYRERLLVPLRPHPEGKGVVLGSPVEAHRPAVLFSVVGLDTAASHINASFAVLEEVTHEEEGDGLEMYDAPTADGRTERRIGKRQISYYIFDASLNHFARSFSTPVSSNADRLIGIPAGVGPGGVVVCAGSELSWVHSDTLPARGLQKYSYIPLRSDAAAQGPNLAVVAAATYKLQRDVFILIQTELGDVFRLLVHVGRATQGAALTARYLDTLPPSRCVVFLRQGYLFSVSEGGDHGLFVVVRDGPPSEDYLGPPATVTTPRGKAAVATFARHEGENIHRRQTVASAAPTLAGVAMPSVRGGRMAYATVGGRAADAAVTFINFGVHAPTVATFALHAAAEKLFACRGVGKGGLPTAHDERVVVSTQSGTTVLRIGDDVSVDATSGFTGDHPTLYAGSVVGGGCVQVHRGGIRVVMSTGYYDWAHEYRQPVACADGNATQLILGFAMGGVASFAADGTGRMMLVATEPNCGEPSAVCLPSSGGGVNAAFCGVAVGNVLYIFATQSMKRVSKSVLRCDDAIFSAAMSMLSDQGLYAFVGLQSGMLLRVAINSTTGAMISSDSLSCGTLPCRVMRGDGSTYLLAHSSEIWRCYWHQGAPVCVPIALPRQTAAISCAVAFDGKHSPRQLLCASAGTLSLHNVDTASGTPHHYESLPLGLSPRRLALHPTLPVAVVMCAEFRASHAERERTKPREGGTSAHRGPSGPTYASALQLIDVQRRVALGAPLKLLEDEAALSMALGVFSELGRDPLLVVGVASSMRQLPTLTATESALHVFRIATHASLGGAPGGGTAPTQLWFVHATRAPDIPSAVHIVGGYLFVGYGPGHGLIAYTAGRKQLLQKRRLNDVHHSRIIDLSAVETAGGMLIACGTVEESVVLVRFHRTAQMHVLFIVGSDPLPRCVLRCVFVDARTIAVCDRLGTLTLLRIPPSLVDDCPSDGMTDAALAARASQSLTVVGSFYAGQCITSLQVVAWEGASGAESSRRILCYTTIGGSIGCLTPFFNESDAVVTSMADSLVRMAYTPLTGRAIDAYRSTFYRSAAVVDVDFLSLMLMPPSGQLTAESHAEVERGLDREQRSTNLQLEKLLGEPPRTFLTVSQVITRMRAALLLV